MRHLRTFGLASVLFLPTFAQSATLYVNNGDALYSRTGSWNTDSPNPTYIRASGDYTADGTATAKFSFSSITANSYAVQVHWVEFIGAGNPPATTTDALYSLNHAGGTFNQHINQHQLSRQDAIYESGTPGTSAVNASGWYTLGTFNLNSSSFVQVSNTDTSGGSLLIADAVRISSDTILVDTTSGAASYNAAWFAGINGTYRNDDSASFDENGGWVYARDNNAVLTITPNLPGQRTVRVSWDTASSLDSNYIRTTDALYTVDLDGNPLTTGDQTLVNYNFRFKADGVSTAAGTNQNWSGFANLGTFNLTANSKIFISNAGQDGYLTAATLEFSIPLPEPTSLGVVALCGLTLIRRRR